MNKKFKFVLPVLAFIAAITVAAVFLRHHNLPVLDPQGMIADKERRLIIIAVSLSMIVVIPVFVMAFVFAWRYRASNTHSKAAYRPDWDNNHFAETVWWGVPTLIIIVLSVITWNSSHQLDPYRPIASNVKPLTIQVVALQWKWLFIYPDQHIATVNYVQFPEHMPVQFEITSDAPMNSFWIPQLGGQIYAMSGMTTQLHLMADKIGSYAGSSANISGAGFAGMKFTARSTSQTDFNTWQQQIRASSKHLTAQTYANLAKPSQNNPVDHYATVDVGLYNTIVMKYMEPTPTDTTSSAASSTPQQSTQKTDNNDSMQGMDMSGMGM